MEMIEIKNVLFFVILVSSALPGKGVKLSLEFETFSSIEDGTYGQLTCTGIGGEYSINSLSVSRMKASGTTIKLLNLSQNSPSNEVVFGNVRGTGTIEKNLAHVRFKLFSTTPDIPANFYTCQAKFVNESGGLETAFAMVGPGLGNIPGQWPEVEKPESSASVFSTTVTDPSQSRISVTEVEFLSNKVARLEQKIDRLDERMSAKLHRNGQKLGALENDAFVKVSTIETNLSTRLSRLEDKLSTFTTKSEPDTENGGKIEALEKRITDLKSFIDKKNVSAIVAGGKTQPMACERGMGDDVTKDYPRYAVLHNDVINRDILCDTHTDGGGWVVFQRRIHGDVDFYRDWTSYREGFGSLTGEFWLGNEAVHQLTDADAYELRIDMRENGKEIFAIFSSFRLESETDKYRLRIVGFTGTATDRLTAHHNNQVFSTFDRDNDANPASCAITYRGAWWYNNCHNSNLNGKWAEKTSTGNVWHGVVPVSFSEMKIRRVKGPSGA